jgi:hypothetical protein
VDEKLVAYGKESGMSKTKVMINALVSYLGCTDDVPLIRRVIEIEKRMTVLEASMKDK